MKTKLREYIDMIFADAPDSARVRDLKEEMYANVCDKYDDLISEGKSESVAYNISIASIGDISELLGSMSDGQSGGDFREEGAFNAFTSAQYEEIKKYRRNSGIMTSVAVSLYIICWVPLVAISAIAEACGANADLWSTVGLGIMAVIVAAATALMILKSSVRPEFLKSKDLDVDGDRIEKSEEMQKRKNPLLKAICRVIWVIAWMSFLLLGICEGLWHPGWIVFLVATALENIIDTIFSYKGKKYL